MKVLIKTLTPHELSILMFFYASPTDCTVADNQESVDTFISMGVLEKWEKSKPDYSDYQITDLGRAWVKIILQTTVPTIAFLDARGKVIR